MIEIPECFYRVSVKALVLNEARDKFLICEEECGLWELPGGGLDWGTTPQEDLPREIQEEMGLEILKIAENPSYFVTDQSLNAQKTWIANVIYETTLKDLNFTPSDECINIRFVDKNDIKDLEVFGTITKLAEMFDPQNHIKPF